MLAVIVSAVRTTVGRAYGTPRATRPTSRSDDHRTVARVPGLAVEVTTSFSAAMPEGEQGRMWHDRQAARGLPVKLPPDHQPLLFFDCKDRSGQDRARGGGAEVIVAGGTESMSMVPMGGNKISRIPGWSITTPTRISIWAWGLRISPASLEFRGAG